MPVKPEREYRLRQWDWETRAAETEEPTYIVEGYATTFNDPYLLYSYDGVDFFEQVDRNAFAETDMTDVIMQYDHEGRVYARQSNGTLELSMDDHGLKVRADLSKTAASRELYDEIKAGLIKEMSFAFSVSEESYDSEQHLRTIRKIKKLYDVSAVSIPANPSTDISARSFCEGVLQREAEELRLRDERERRKAKIRILLEVSK